MSHCDIRANEKTEIRKYSQAIHLEHSSLFQGISLLELKCHLMLNYLSSLSYLSLRKLNQKSIRGDSAVFRLAEIRTVSWCHSIFFSSSLFQAFLLLQVLERMRPIEQKLQYQIDKLIKAANAPG